MEENKLEERKQAVTRILAGGVLGGALFFLIGALFNGISEGALRGRGDLFVPISNVLIKRTGSVVTALLIEMILYGILGALVGGASLPFAEERDKLFLRSFSHFIVIASIATLFTWLCDWNKGEVGLWLLLIGIIAAIYFIIWIGRWIGWNGEIRQIRDKLGIKKKQSFLNWRETIPYLLFMLIATVILFLIGFGIHGIVVVLIIPWIIMPFLGFGPGFSMGRRYGFCPLYPIAVPFLYYAAFDIVKRMEGWNVGQDWWFYAFPGICALIGNIVGSVIHFRAQKRE